MGREVIPKVGLLNALFFVFSNDYKYRVKRDSYRPGTAMKNMISPINNCCTCFKCDGRGKIDLECCICDRTGEYNGQCKKCSEEGGIEFPEQPCFTCNNTGVCLKMVRNLSCGGAGIFKDAKLLLLTAVMGSVNL